MWQPSWACPTEGCFYPPTLFTDVRPSSTIAQVEIFGPVLVTMTFRTPDESVALANNTPYGLAASIWSESINLALDIAPKIKAGVVWVNSTNLFDAAAGFGGYRESGFGREGGREGMWEYVKPSGSGTWRRRRRWMPPAVNAPAASLRQRRRATSRHPRRQSTAPPNSSSAANRRGPIRGTRDVCISPSGELVGEVAEGNRKDIRNAVEAAHAASGKWARARPQSRPDSVLHRRESFGAARRSSRSASAR